jgi:hypothetical protein
VDSGTMKLGDTVSGKNQNFGALTLSGTSTLDFGDGASGNAMTFDPTATFSGTLAIWNWTGPVYNPAGSDGGIIGDGQDRLLFDGTGSGFSPAQLAAISFFSDDGITQVGSGFTAQISFGSQFEIVPVPEPSSAALLGAAGLLALAGYRERRRRGTTLNRESESKVQ